MSADEQSGHVPGRFGASPEPSGPTRRDILRWMAYGGVGLAGAGAADWQLRSAAQAERSRPWHLNGRVLVVVELGGGNDGLSTLIPYGDGKYRDLRPLLAIDESEVIDWGGGWGVNRRLGDLERRGLTVVAGVGSESPDLSHFEMMDRWYRADPSGRRANGSFAAGFLGRMCDALAEPGALAGVSLRFGESPIIRADRSFTVGLGSMSGSVFSDVQAVAEVRDLLASFDGEGGSAGMEEALRQIRAVAGVLGLFEALPAASPGYPDSELGDQLAFASRLIKSENGVRVVHVPMGSGNRFDTHKNHRKLHADLMVQLNDAVAAFVDDLRRHGVGDEVLVATISEFGRRPAEHTDGLDHGTASVMMMMGPTVPGLHGEPSSLSRLDEFDNLVATLRFDRYYATLAQWLGIDPVRVLIPESGSRVEPLPGVLHT